MRTVSSKKPIIMVAAMDRLRAIGRGNHIPWRIPGEQRRFKEITMGNALIMGRLTFESIGRPLPGRHIIVMSKSPAAQFGTIRQAGSVDEALELADDLPGDSTIIGGGQGVYEIFLPVADRIYLTEIDAAYGGDRHFPGFSTTDFALVNSEPVEGPVPFTYRTYERRKG